MSAVTVSAVAWSKLPGSLATTWTFGHALIAVMKPSVRSTVASLPGSPVTIATFVGLPAASAHSCLPIVLPS